MPSPLAALRKRFDRDLADAVGLRPAVRADIPAIEAMHFLSVQALAARDFSPAEMEAFLGHVGTYDPRLIDDGTYFVLEHGGHLVGSGGWSSRAPHFEVGETERASRPECRAPQSARDSAKVRSIFVHPNYARLGLGSRLVHNAEAEAAAAGFRLAELWATLTGVPLYRKLGYEELGRFAVPAANGVAVPAVHMAKRLPAKAADSSAA